MAGQQNAAEKDCRWSQSCASGEVLFIYPKSTTGSDHQVNCLVITKHVFFTVYVSTMQIADICVQLVAESPVIIKLTVRSRLMLVHEITNSQWFFVRYLFPHIIVFVIILSVWLEPLNGVANNVKHSHYCTKKLIIAKPSWGPKTDLER